MVLLPRLRDDIDEYKKLNFHLYQALHKAMYKPQAFFKGIIFPLCEVFIFSIQFFSFSFFSNFRFSIFAKREFIFFKIFF